MKSFYLLLVCLLSVFSSTACKTIPTASEAKAVTESQQVPFDLINYSPFRDGQAPGGASPSLEQIREDIRLLKPLTHEIRIYGVDGPARDILKVCWEEGMGVHLGLWISSDKAANENQIALFKTIVQDYAQSEKKGLIKSLIVGSEVLYRERDISVQDLISYIERVKAWAFPYPVTTSLIYTDPGFVEIAKRVDFVVFHVHPFWEEKYTAEQSAARVIEVWDIVAGRLKEAGLEDKPLVIGETGWPTRGDLGRAKGSEANQKLFVNDLWTRIKDHNRNHKQPVRVWFFSAFDENWKVGAEGAQGTAWGLFDIQRKPKSVLKSLLNLKEAPSLEVLEDLTVRGGSKVSLAAKATAGSSPLKKFSWQQITGPKVILTGSDSKTVSFASPSVGSTSELSFRVTVEDEEGQSTSALVTVRVVSEEESTNAADFGSRRMNGKLVFFVKKANWAIVHYRVNGGVQQNLQMAVQNGEHIYEVPGLKSGDKVEFFFTISGASVQDTPIQTLNFS